MLDPITRLRVHPEGRYSASSAGGGGRLVRYLAFLLSLLITAGCESDSGPLAPDEPIDWAPEGPNALNLGFEQATADNRPKRWSTGGEGYEVTVVDAPTYDGDRSLAMRHVSGTGFGVATSVFPLEDARSRRLKLIGYIRTQNVTTDGWAGLWMRVDGSDGRMLAFDNMSDRPVRGNSDWTRAEIELLVAPDAHRVVFGALHPGPGIAWFDALWFEVDGVPYQPSLVTDISEAQLDWLTRSVQEFRTEEPDTGFDDLTFLSDMVGQARIISLGEGTHGTSEFFKMKHRITEFLAHEMGATVFAIEANMPESRAINRYVLDGEGDAITALNGIYFWTWYTQEVLDMIEWMRSYNASGQGQIQFYGFDAQTPTVAADNVEAFIAELEPSYSESVRASYDVVRRVYADRIRSYSDPSVVVDLKAWLDEASKVLNHLEARRADYLANKPAIDVDWAIQDARVVLQAGDPRSRDRSMADNVDWILEHSPADTRIVLWAHNGHVKRAPSRMGGYLSERHGDDMAVFGFAFHEGRYTAVGPDGLGTYTTSASEPGSVEWAFHNTGVERAMLDLRLANPDDSASGWLTRSIDFRSIGAVARSYAFSRTVLTDDYEVIVYFDQSTASQLLTRPLLDAVVPLGPGPFARVPDASFR